MQEHSNHGRLTSKAVRQLLPKSMATAMGHLDQQRKNVCSTRRPTTSPTTTAQTLKLETIWEEDEENEGWTVIRQKTPKPMGSCLQDTTMIPTTDLNINRKDIQPSMEDPTNNAFASIVEFNETEGKSYSDLTGRFPCKSDRGNLYVLVIYVYNDNAILVEPIKNRSEPEQIKAYKKLLDRAEQGSTIKMHWMDNEASKGVKDLLTNEYKLTYQLVPPHIHRRNTAERAIRTFKNHFIAGLSSADDQFPMRLWD
jgi:hypothetical protein